MKRLAGIAIAVVVAGCGGSAPAPPPVPEPAAGSHEAIATAYVRAWNTGAVDTLARVVERVYAPDFLADFGGPAAAAAARLDLRRTYGPVEPAFVDSAATPPIVWFRGTITGGWYGHQLYLNETGRAERHTVWRARPVPLPAAAGLPPRAVADSLGAWLARLAEHGLFSGSVVLSHAGRRLLARSHGSTRQDSAAPVTSETRFHIASVTKLPTVVAFLQLVEAGRVSLDDSLGRWIPEYPEPWAGTVRMRHLLTHTSGIELDEDPAYLAEVRQARTAEDLLAAQMRFIEGRESRFAPGSEYDYTSEGIDLLAVVMERVTGRPWTEVVRERVLEAVGMHDTRFAVPRDEGRWALGFTALTGDLETATTRLRPALEVLTAVAKPSSGLWSTAEDLHRFAEALLDGRLLGPELRDALLTPQVETGELPKYGIDGWVGLGAQGEDLWGIRTVGHGGVVPGYSAAIEYLPEGEWLLTVVSNTGEATGFLVFQRVLELAAAARPRSR